ncbi:MAG: hypothetical protein KHY88_08920 [Erysipelotrichaceae bacterium]|nr:hypothetical protein [Erysipelotrichaceae bacterium]
MRYRKLIVFIFFLICLSGCGSKDITRKNDKAQKILVKFNGENDLGLLDKISSYTEEVTDVYLYIEGDTTDDEDYKVTLTKDKNYSQVIYLPEGNYSFESNIFSSYDNETSLSVSSFAITKTNVLDEIVISINENVVNRYLSEITIGDEIMNADVNSGKVQYKGEIFTLPSNSLLRKVLNKELHTLNLEPYEIYEKYNYKIYNNSNEKKNILDCVLVGIETSNENFVFPKGISTFKTAPYVKPQVDMANRLFGLPILLDNSLKFYASTLDYEVAGLDEKTEYKIELNATGEGSIAKISYEHW